MLRVGVVDDERLARQALRRALSQIGGVEIVGEADGLKSALELIERERPVGIFLDVQMPLGDGFELAREIAAGSRVVFVTAHAEHAVRAFEIDAVDYLLKPVRVSRLEAAVNRLRAVCETADGGEECYAAGDRICLRTPGRTLVTGVSKLVALEADGDFTRVFVAGEKPVLICRSLGNYEGVLPKEIFVRIDRSRIVNRALVRRWRRVSRDEGLLWLEGREDPLRLGRAAQGRLREALGRVAR
ncbi:MAG: LytTR family DNA-binding domain-containing protein [Chthoniobacterales bacterium]